MLYNLKTAGDAKLFGRLLVDNMTLEMINIIFLFTSLSHASRQGLTEHFLYGSKITKAAFDNSLLQPSLSRSKNVFINKMVEIKDLSISCFHVENLNEEQLTELITLFNHKAHSKRINAIKSDLYAEYYDGQKLVFTHGCTNQSILQGKQLIETKLASLKRLHQLTLHQ
ncbi:MAG: hypothetical protein HAW67_03625 [Endozoicomonadaceae bacterium]|nr:hypothetical protein [Endozoicomonadaceae bacterium]